MNQYLYVFMTALSVALIMVPFLRRWALTTGTVDIPDARKVHTTAVPRIGGIAIFMSFLFALLVYVDLQPALCGLLAGGLIVFFTGFVDDLHGITPRRKFLGEIGGCLVTMVVGNLYITNLGNLFGSGAIVLPLWLAVPFTVFAMVGVINAVNLIDGLDGLAGGVSVIALGTFFLLGWQTGNSAAMVVSAGLLGAILGFLKYNYFPARIFMGDTGSLMVGFLLGFTAVLLTQGPAPTVTPVVPVMVLGLPIIDTLWVMTSRLLQRKSPFAPDMTHVHHKFLNLGFEHRFTVIVIYGISLFWALASLVLRNLPDYLLLGLFLSLSGLFYLALRQVLRHPRLFKLARRDSATGWREAELYRRLAELSDRSVPLLFGGYLLYLGGAVLLARPDCGVPPSLFGLFLVAGIGGLAWKKTLDQPQLLLWLYLGNLILAFTAETCGARAALAGLQYASLSNLFFLVFGALLGVKLAMRQAGEFFLSGVDLLCLGLVVFSGVLNSNFGASPELLTALFKGLLLVTVLKLANDRRPLYRQTAFAATLLALLVAAVRVLG